MEKITSAKQYHTESNIKNLYRDGFDMELLPLDESIIVEIHQVAVYKENSPIPPKKTYKVCQIAKSVCY